MLLKVELSRFISTLRISCLVKNLQRKHIQYILSEKNCDLTCKGKQAVMKVTLGFS